MADMLPMVRDLFLKLLDNLEHTESIELWDPETLTPIGPEMSSVVFFNEEKEILK